MNETLDQYRYRLVNTPEREACTTLSIEELYDRSRFLSAIEGMRENPIPTHTSDKKTAPVAPYRPSKIVYKDKFSD